MNMLKNFQSKRKKEIIGSLAMLAICVLPFFAFASHRNSIFVNAGVSSSGDGSAAHPYKTINEALRHSSDKTDIDVANGRYKENIEIPEGVNVFGESRDGVVITADDNNNSTVIMHDDSEIDKVTIRKGANGIHVKDGAKASIVDCKIEDNDDDGIHIDEGAVKDSREVSISNNEISGNGRGGIYSDQRRLVLMDNHIDNNDSDGVSLEKGSSAWIQDNTIENNGGSGMRLTLDDSNIWTKDNVFHNNNHQGIEVNAYGESGRIDINKSDFNDNDNFGIARIQRGNFSSNIWSGLTVEKNTTFNSNGKGDISPVEVIS